MGGYWFTAVLVFLVQVPAESAVEFLICCWKVRCITLVLNVFSLLICYEPRSIMVIVNIC